MKFTALFAAVVALPTLVMGTQIKYDPGYDNVGRSMNEVSCSDGPNGLAHRFPTLGRVPSFPHVAAVPGANWGSPMCGSCWEIKYKGKTMYVTAVDYSGSAFVLSKQAMDELTDGQATHSGVVEASTKPADKSKCRL